MNNESNPIESQLNLWDFPESPYIESYGVDFSASELNQLTLDSTIPVVVSDVLKTIQVKPSTLKEAKHYFDHWLNNERKVPSEVQYYFDKYRNTPDEDELDKYHINLNLLSCDRTKSARHYQEEGIKFGLGFDNDQWISKPNKSIRICIADQMRLGKTPQSLLIVKNAIASGLFKKILIIVRATNLWQWVDEHKTWLTPLPNGIWPITSTKGFIPQGFTSYIVSMNSIRNMEDLLIAQKFDCIISDESHSFKNLDSSRTISFNRIVKETPVQNIIFLTGTPIKNRADEYFTILNTCRSDLFPSFHQYKSEWLEQDSKGKYTRIKDWRLEEFRQTIVPFIIRREKEDVYNLHDLPEFNRMYTTIKIEEKHLKDLYNRELDKMNEKIAETGKANYLALADSLMVLRRICGMAKVPATLEYITEFIEESEDEKIAIGIHHKDVRETLRLKIPRDYGVITLSGEDSAARKYDIQERIMKDARNRVLIINSLAGGVGMDFHYINNFLVTERQWNSADESQFEFRFYNPDKSIKKCSTFGEYFIAQGTVDEFLHKMVMKKKETFDETLNTYDYNIENDNTSFKELVQETMDNRL